MPVFLLIVLLAGLAAGQTTIPFKATPTSIAFTYTVGDAKLPAAQTLSIAGATGGTAFTAAVSGGPWLTISPAGGTTPVSAKVLANPSTLEPGSYSATVVLTTTTSSPQTVTVPVTLVIKAAPALLTVNPVALTFVYTRGLAVPADQTITLSTNGATQPYTLTIAGGTWLSTSAKSGFAMLGFPSSLTVGVNPAGLVPGSYKGSITVAAPSATNKSTSISVTLTVNPGLPLLTSIWPNRVVQGTPSTTITVSGDNFFSGTIVKAGATTLATTFIGPNVVTAVLPASLMVTAGSLNILATNVGVGGGDSSAQVFTVRPPGPLMDSVVNAASFASGPIAPGTMVVIFGTGLGPDALTVFTAPIGTAGTVATTLATTRVWFGSIAAPVIYTSATQVAAMAPWELAGSSSVDVRVEFNGVQSATTNYPVNSGSPGIFTTGNGSGQAAAFNVDETTGAYTLNSDTATAPKGSTVVFFFTGEGSVSPAAPTGSITSSVSSTPNPNVSITIGGEPAQISYAGPMPGTVSGISQVNAKLSDTTPVGKAVPVILTVSGTPSQAGVTIGVK